MTFYSLLLLNFRTSLNGRLFCSPLYRFRSALGVLLYLDHFICVRVRVCGVVCLVSLINVLYFLEQF